MYNFHKSDNNCIGDEGLVLVLNKQLPCLQKLILSNFTLTAGGSRITSVGLRSLPDAQFQNIKMLCLCILGPIQLKTV